MRGRLQDRSYFERLPAVRTEEIWSLAWGELERGIGFRELLLPLALQHPQQPGRCQVEDPALEAAGPGEVLRQRAYMFAIEIDQEPLAEDEYPACVCAELIEQLATSLLVGQVETNTLERATGFSSRRISSL